MLNSEDLNKVKIYNKFLNPEKLNKIDFAVKAHGNQKRPLGIHILFIL